ncbi:MAG: DUF2971 domain-containing protein, partial [Hydrogenophaga sp.]|uniref:DUF2971 domain-containing protein n=1 Tax=Hydrogenophaga sp. TaxID=1904254 RepID=UPI0025C72BDB
MPYKAHHTFSAPQDQDHVVWRYLDLSKFAHVLFTRTLHFTRIDQFSDPFEGSASLLAANSLVEFYKNAVEEAKISVLHQERPEALRADFLNTRELRATTYANCWHLSAHESAAMWNQYLIHGEGIAICSTYRKLQSCFQETQDDVFLGAIRYIDYEKENFYDVGNMFSYVMHKRKSFEHEKEVRAVISRWGPDNLPNPKQGINVHINLETLIDKIYVAPGTGSWLTETVQ